MELLSNSIHVRTNYNIIVDEGCWEREVEREICKDSNLPCWEFNMITWCRSFNGLRTNSSHSESSSRRSDQLLTTPRLLLIYAPAHRNLCTHLTPGGHLTNLIHGGARGQTRGEWLRLLTPCQTANMHNFQSSSFIEGESYGGYGWRAWETNSRFFWDPMSGNAAVM